MFTAGVDADESIVLGGCEVLDGATELQGVASYEVLDDISELLGVSSAGVAVYVGQLCSSILR